MTNKPSDDEGSEASDKQPVIHGRGTTSHGNRLAINSTQQPDSQSPGTVGGRLGLMPSIYAALVLAFLTITAFRLLGELSFLLILLYLSVLVACGISGPVARLERLGLHRSLGILVMFAIFGGIMLAIGWYALPTLIGQSISVAEDLPDHISRLEHYRARFSAMQQEYPVLEQVDSQIGTVLESIGSEATTIAVAIPSAIAKGAFGLTSILTFSFLFLMTWERMRDTILSLVQPRHREKSRDVFDEIGVRLGAYLRAKIIIMVIVGIWMYVALMLLGSPYALLAAIFIGLMEGLPKIGPWIGRIGMVLLLIPMGWKVIVIAVIAHIVIDNIKGYLLSPLIEGNQVDIHPLTAFIAVIAGGLLLGWVGAFVAVPTAAIIQVVIEQVVLPWRRGQLANAEAESSVGQEI